MLSATVALGVVVLIVTTLTRGRNKSLNKQEYRVRWLEIENGLDKNNLATYQFAVLAADKLLDQALRESGIDGDTTSDRLKYAKRKLSAPNLVKTAHKWRDRIAHQANTEANPVVMRRVLATYKKSLKELGAI
jgi:hypothetical protein